MEELCDNTFHCAFIEMNSLGNTVECVSLEPQVDDLTIMVWLALHEAVPLFTEPSGTLALAAPETSYTIMPGLFTPPEVV